MVDIVTRVIAQMVSHFSHVLIEDFAADTDSIYCDF